MRFILCVSTDPVSRLFFSSAMEKNRVVAIQETGDLTSAMRTLNAATQMYLSVNVRRATSQTLHLQLLQELMRRLIMLHQSLPGLLRRAKHLKQLSRLRTTQPAESVRNTTVGA